jgi:hypothetical protein
MNMSPQEMAAAAAAMVRQSGAPLSAENMNRAMSAVMSGQTSMEGGNSPVMERAMQRTMQPRRTGAVRGGEGSLEATTQDNMQTDPTYAEDAAAGGDWRNGPPAALITGEQTQQPQTRGANVAAGVPTARRAGTINTATRINEENPEAGMYEGAQPRQADETGVDQTGLGMALLAPLASAGGAAAMATNPIARALMARLLGRGAVENSGYVASQAVNAPRNMTMAQNIATSDRNLRAMQQANRLRGQGVNARPNMQRIQRLPNAE